MNRKMREAYRKVGINYHEPEVIEVVKPEAERQGVGRRKPTRGKLVTMTKDGGVIRVNRRSAAPWLRDGWAFCSKSAHKAQFGA